MTNAPQSPAVMRDPLRVMAKVFAHRYLRTKAAEESFAEFVRQAFHTVEPDTEFQDNWHIDGLCEHLQATVPDGREPGLIRQLVITMPPRSMKTLIISVFFPCWVWIRYPHLRFLYASYADGLSSEHSDLTRTVIESEWYQSRWGHVVRLKKGDNLKTRFSTTRLGRRQATSVGAKTTGLGGDFVIVDDPHNVQRAESKLIREATVRWWTKAMSSRINNRKTGVRIIVQQRVHEEDVAGVAIASGEYVHLNLPMEYEETDYISPTGWQDPRDEPGELFWPERFPAGEVEKLKRELGSYDYAAQYQQRPVPIGGGILKKSWLRFWQYPGMGLEPVTFDGVAHPLIDLPGFFDNQLQSWDLNFKKTTSGSYVAALVAGVFGAQTFLLDRYRERTDFPGTVTAFLHLTDRWPQATVKLVEDKANGPALMSTLQSRVPGIIAVQPDGDKEARMHSVSPYVEGGGLVLPHPSIAPWVKELIDEITSFPLAAHNDQADALSQMLRRVMANTQGGFTMGDVMAAMFGGA